MANVSTRLHRRNPQSLPLFDWAERQSFCRRSKLRVTTKLARRFNLPTTTLNAWAEANGFTATAGNQPGYGTNRREDIACQ